MGKPYKKLKRILLILGITGAVYGVFRYLLPLVIPFLLAWGLALLLRPSAFWLARYSRITLRMGGRKKTIFVPAGIIGVVELLLIICAVTLMLYFGGRKLCLEAGMFLEQIPIWVSALDTWLTGMCHQVENCFCLPPDCLVLLMREMLQGLMESLKQTAMPYLMVNSVTIFQYGVKASVVSVILLVSVGMILGEMELWRRRCEDSLFQKEFALIAHRLAIVANAYLKTQGIIMVLTTLICMAGLWILKNPYYLLAGIGIGILDALPIFGTGTVLIPWAMLCFFGRNWGEGMILLVLYLICYFLRELLEAKLMGNQVGLTSLETLISMYAGLKLFGIFGLFLGPIGLLLIEDLVKSAEET
ncbi:MAG: AI-2E family transporter [Lachnospiraceae bacterium]|nr:AI-2E family transporter [Lachnospiraceae bacterium]